MSGPSTDDAYAASYPITSPSVARTPLSRPLSEPGDWTFAIVPEARRKKSQPVTVTHKHWFAARKLAAMKAGCCPGDLRLVLSPFMGAT